MSNQTDIDNKYCQNSQTNAMTLIEDEDHIDDKKKGWAKFQNKWSDWIWEYCDSLNNLILSDLWVTWHAELFPLSQL